MDGSWKSFQDESFIPEEDWKDSLALSSYLKMRRSRASPGAPERHNDLSPIAGFGTPFASMPRANLSILTSPLHRLERDERDSSPSAPLSTRTTMRDNEEEDVLADTSAADSFFLKLLLRKAIREKDVLREEVASLQRIREIHVKESQQKVEDTVKLRAENRKMRLAAGCAILRGMLRGLYVRCMSKVMGRWRTHIYQQHTHHTHTLRREFVLSKARAAIQKQRRGVMCVSLGRWVRYIHHIHSMEDMMVTKGVCKTQYVYVRKFIITLKKMYAMKRMCRVMLKGVMRRVWMCMRRYGTYRLLSVCNMYKGVCMVYRYTLTQHALRHVIGVWKEDIHCHKRQSIVCRRLASMVQRHTYTYIIHRAWCVWKTYIRQTDKVHTLMKGVCRSWYKRLVAHGMDMLRRNVHVHKCMGHHIHKLVYVHRQYQVRSAYKKWNVYVNSVKRKHMVLQRVLCMMDMYRGRMPNYFYWWRGLVCARGLQQHIQAITTTHTQELANMAHILHHTHQHIYQCGGTRLLKSTRNIIMRKVFQHWCMVQTTTSKHSHHRQQSLLRTVKILYHRLLCRGMSRWKRCCRVWRVMGMMVASLEICGLRHGMVRWKTHTRHVSKLQQKLARIFGILKRQKLKSCHQHWRERSWYLSRCRNHMYNLLAHLSHYHVRWCMHQWKIGIITKTLTIPYTMSLTKYTKLSLKHVMVCWKRYVGMARGVRGGIGRVLKCLTNHHIHRAYTTWKYHTRSTCKLSRMVRLLYHHRYQHLARGWGRWVWYVMGMVRGMCIQHQVQNQLHKQHIQSMQHHIHVTEIMVENLGGHMVHTHANRLKYKVFSMWRVYVHTQRRMLKSVMRMLHHNLHHSLHRAWAIWKHHAIHQTHSLQSKMDLQNLQSKYAFEKTYAALLRWRFGQVHRAFGQWKSCVITLNSSLVERLRKHFIQWQAYLTQLQRARQRLPLLFLLCASQSKREAFRRWQQTTRHISRMHRAIHTWRKHHTRCTYTHALSKWREVCRRTRGAHTMFKAVQRMYIHNLKRSMATWHTLVHTQQKVAHTLRSMVNLLSKHVYVQMCMSFTRWKDMVMVYKQHVMVLRFRYKLLKRTHHTHILRHVFARWIRACMCRHTMLLHTPTHRHNTMHASHTIHSLVHHMYMLMMRSEEVWEVMGYVHQVMWKVMGGSGEEWEGQVYVMDEDRVALTTVYGQGDGYGYENHSGEGEEMVLLGQTRVGRSAQYKRPLFFTAITPPTPTHRSNSSISEGLALVCIPLLNGDGACMGVLKFTHTRYSPRSVEHTVGLREVMEQGDGGGDGVGDGGSMLGRAYGNKGYGHTHTYTQAHTQTHTPSNSMVCDALLRMHLGVHTILVVMQMAHHLSTILAMYRDRRREMREGDGHNMDQGTHMSPFSPARPPSTPPPSSPSHIHHTYLGSLHLNTTTHTAHTQTQTHTPLQSPTHTHPPSPVAVTMQLNHAQQELLTLQTTYTTLQSECDTVRGKYAQCMQEIAVKDTRLGEMVRELEGKERELKEVKDMLRHYKKKVRRYDEQLAELDRVNELMRSLK